MEKEKVLALDTSTNVLAMALAEGDMCRWFVNYAGRSRHQEKLFSFLQEGLHSLGWTANDLSVLVCGLGPGSFTGLRVGLSAIKGLGSVGTKKIVGLSSLDVIAQNGHPDRETIVIVDARRDSVYAAFYSKQGRKRGKDMCLSVAELCERINARKSNNPVDVLGDGVRAYGDSIVAQCGERVMLRAEERWYARAEGILAAAQPLREAGNFMPVHDAVPHYIRLSAAEEVKKSKKK